MAVKYRCRSYAAVATDGIGAPLSQPGRCRFRRRAVQAVGVLVDRHHHQNWQGRGHIPCRKDGLLCLIQRRNSFDQQHIDAALDQAANLLGEDFARFRQAGLSQWFQAHAERPDCTRYPGFAALLVGPLIYRLTRHLGSGAVDLHHPVGEAITLQTQGIGAERIGLDDLRAGLQVFLVDIPYQIRLRDIQFVEAAIDKDSAGIQTGAHSPVAQHVPCPEDLCEPIRHRVGLIMLSHPGRDCQSPLCYTWPFPHVRRVVILVRS